MGFLEKKMLIYCPIVTKYVFDKHKGKEQAVLRTWLKNEKQALTFCSADASILGKLGAKFHFLKCFIIFTPVQTRKSKCFLLF